MLIDMSAPLLESIVSTPIRRDAKCLPPIRNPRHPLYPMSPQPAAQVSVSCPHKRTRTRTIRPL